MHQVRNTGDKDYSIFVRDDVTARKVLFASMQMLQKQHNPFDIYVE